MRNSVKTGADLLFDIVEEQKKRELLKNPKFDNCGYWPEKELTINHKKFIL